MFFSQKKSSNVKISNKKISFFSSRNQYFPHIPYVASRKWTVQHSKSSKLETSGGHHRAPRFFFRNSVDETFFRTLRSSSGVKMEEIEDVYFFALYGNGQLSRDIYETVVCLYSRSSKFPCSCYQKSWHTHNKHICFFYEVGLSDQCSQRLLHEGKPYLGFEPIYFSWISSAGDEYHTT
jgi:hypothetical protein